MSRSLVVVILVVVMIALIVTTDVLFLRNRFQLRLAVNIAIVLAFGLIYFVFVRQ